MIYSFFFTLEYYIIYEIILYIYAPENRSKARKQY